MDAAAFRELDAALDGGEKAKALTALRDRLVSAGNFHRLFDALALTARIELGLPAVVAPGQSEMSVELRDRYEARLTEACREVGGRFLDAGDFAAAFHYFNSIGELDALRVAIDAYDAAADEAGGNAERIETVVDVAVSRGVNPSKGLAIVLERYGTCQGITAGQGIVAQETRPEVREACIKLLVRRLYDELVERLAVEVRAKDGPSTPAASVSLLLENRPWLFADENYHIDTSHLNSVVRMARMLPKCDEAFQAIQLCDYGRKLSERYQFSEAPPFEKIYDDTRVFLRAICGLETTKAIDHFRAKVDEADVDEVGTYPAEVLVDLLVRTKRIDEAIAVAAERLNDSRLAPSACPTVNELCRRAGKYDRMRELAEQRGDLVSYMAALFAT